SATLPTCPHPFPTRRSSDLVEEAVADPPLGAAGLVVDGDHQGVQGVHIQLMEPPVEVQLRHQELLDVDLGGEEPSRSELALPHVDRKSTRLNSSHVKISYAV